MLALGTGVNAALFSVIALRGDAATPFSHPENIVRLCTVNDNKRAAVPTTLERFDALAAAPGPFQTVSVFAGGTHIFTSLARRSDGVAGGVWGPAAVLDVECVSSAMFDILGTPPMLGRPFTPPAAEDQPNAPATMVASSIVVQSAVQNAVRRRLDGHGQPDAGDDSRRHAARIRGALCASDAAAPPPLPGCHFSRPVALAGAGPPVTPRRGAINVFARSADGGHARKPRGWPSPTSCFPIRGTN